MNKLTSRKFWFAVAAFLASVGTGITGLAIENPDVAIAGAICTILAAAIYQAAEAYVDAAHASANGTSKVITAQAMSTNIVESALVDNQKS